MFKFFQNLTKFLIAKSNNDLNSGSSSKLIFCYIFWFLLFVNFSYCSCCLCCSLSISSFFGVFYWYIFIALASYCYDKLCKCIAWYFIWFLCLKDFKQPAKGHTNCLNSNCRKLFHININLRGYKSVSWDMVSSRVYCHTHNMNKIL